MSSPPDASTTHAQPHVATLHERSDKWIAQILGHDLQGATVRATLYLLIVAAVLATLAWLIG